jgi:hypothetical protein
MRPPYRPVWPRISGTAPRDPTIQPITSALESHQRYALSASAGVVASDRRDIVIPAKASHLYFAKMSLMIFSATAFCDAKNR